MTNTYRALSSAAEAAFAPGVFEAEFTPADEQDRLASGLLELVPRPYRVLVNNYTAGKEGEVVDLALLVEVEGALLAGGFLERCEPPKQDEPSPAPSRKRSSK